MSTATENEQTKQLLAFEVEVNGMVAIVFAATISKAKWMAVESYWDVYCADYHGKARKRVWPQVKAGRAPEHDSNPLRNHGRKCYSPSYVRGYP